MSAPAKVRVDVVPERAFLVSFFSTKRDNSPQQRLWTWTEICEEVRNPVIRVEKDGPLFSPAKFNGKRANVNVEQLSMLTLDLDHDSDLEQIKQGLAALSCKYIIYSTHSHLRKTASNPKAEPRYRAVIPLKESIPVKQFSALWLFAKRKTGLPIDEGAKDPSRMYYRPAVVNSVAEYQFYVHDGAILNWTSLALAAGDAYSSKPRDNGHFIIKGQRNSTLFKIAKNLYLKGQSSVEVEVELGKINNSKCSPPLDELELRSISQNAQKYPVTLSDMDAGTDGNGESKENQADKVIRLVEALGVLFFHNAEGDAFVTVRIQDHFENHKVKSTFFREWIGQAFWNSEGKVPSTKALQDAVNALTGRAKFASPEDEVFVRIAEVHGRIYLDLANERWQIVEVSDTDWRIIEGVDAPVKFRRPKGLLALPNPMRGDNAQDLLHWINVSEEHFPLVCVWVLACFRTGKPFPVVILNGEQGSAKSTTTRVLRRLIDPNLSELRTSPRDERDLMIAATNGWILAFDNLSKIQDWLSDALCRISTGGGFSTRTLYENDEETMFSAKRPIIINGITELATRADLLDRSLIISCPNISKSRRRDEETFWSAFEVERPRLLGSLLTALSKTLNRLPQVKLTEAERMADFEKFGVAAEWALGFEAGTFQQRYKANRCDAIEIALESSPTATLVIEFLRDRSDWSGTASSLLRELSEFADKHRHLGIKTEDLPKRANALSGELKKVSPNLRAHYIDFERAKSGGRTIKLQKTGETSPSSSVASIASDNNSLKSDDVVDDELDDHSSDIHNIEPLKVDLVDDADGADDESQHFSLEIEEQERIAIMTVDGGVCVFEAEQ